MSSTAKDWSLERGKGSERLVTRERYYNLEHQTAVMRRGQELLVLAAAPMPSPLDKSGKLDAFLAVGRVSDFQVLFAPARIDSKQIFRGSISADSGSYLASIEVVGEKAIGRARHGAPVPPLVDGFGVSDLALVNQAFEADSLDLLNALLPTAAVSAGSRVGLYFEVYGLSGPENLEISITGVGAKDSGVRNLFGILGGSRTPMRAAWQERIERPEREFHRFFLLDTSTLPKGQNQLVLTVRRANGMTASVTRSLEVK